MGAVAAVMENIWGIPASRFHSLLDIEESLISMQGTKTLNNPG
jgi:hypothetical protein